MIEDQEDAFAKPDTARIRELNDAFRKSLVGGKVVVTAGVNALGSERLEQLLSIVRTFDQFNEDNDPHGEHDFGAFKSGTETFFWKIDTYDKQRRYGSENPADPKMTTRVLTIMLATEW